jgi:hypothetical protein
MSARTSQARSSGRLSSVFVSDQPCPILDYIAQAAARHNTSDWRPLFDSRAGHFILLVLKVEYKSVQRNNTHSCLT